MSYRRTLMYGIGAARKSRFDVVDGNVFYLHHLIACVENNVKMVVIQINRIYENIDDCPPFVYIVRRQFHSDRGTQYTSFIFRKLLDERNVVQSFSKKGYPFDNAVAESFFKYWKKEETNRRSYSSFSELKLSLFQYIEGFYNSKRPHSSIAYLTPNQKELEFYSCS